MNTDCGVNRYSVEWKINLEDGKTMKKEKNLTKDTSNFTIENVDESAKYDVCVIAISASQTWISCCGAEVPEGFFKPIPMVRKL